MSLFSTTDVLTEAQKSEFCSIVRFGCDRVTAGKYLGCSMQQLRSTLQHDPQFAKQLARAEATPELMHMRNLQNAAKDEKHWRASIWWLERCVPERYARRNPDSISAAQLRQVVKQLADAIAGEVSDLDDRTRLMKRLASIAGSIEGEPESFTSEIDQEFAA